MGVIIGPILGPALGGWLTENYNWRWVFYINVPFGILAFLGILSAVPETLIRKTRFDFFGFAALSIGIGSLQLMLDRGQLKDWFSSTEIWVEAVIAGLALYLFIVHMLTTKRTPFISPALFKDRNFLTGNIFIFVVGVVLFATLALLPPLLQDLLNYPVVLTGLVTAPRGIGTLVAMFVVGRIMGKVDTRIIIAAGFGLTALSLWQMTGFYLQMGTSSIVWSGLAQGLGTGFVYVPLAAITFATLSPRFRNEGTAVFSLIRNVGSSIGISVVETLLTRNTQMMHSRLAEQITPYGDVLHLQPPSALSTAHGLATLNAGVTGQAAMIAYNNDFKLMMVLTLCAIPLVALLRSGQPQKSSEPVVIE
jgi:DHA2 family multidrug resistance protein